MSNLMKRRVAVMMSDSYHQLQLVEVTTLVRRNGIEGPYRIDKLEVERLAQARLKELGMDRSDEANRRLGINHWDMVGVLVAHENTPLERGRISWAEEVDTREAVTL